VGIKSVLVAIWLISCLPLPALAGPAEDFSTAFNNQNAPAMEQALAKGAPVDRFEGGLTPLIMAAASGRTDIVKLLLDHGANPNLRADASMGGMTAIQAAAGTGAVDVISLLLDRGVSVESTDLMGGTPLDYASSQGKTKSIALLYARGGNVNAAQANGMTPLHYAAGGGKKDAVALLVAMGANVSARDSDGRTPYDVAAATKGLSAGAKADVLALLAPRGPVTPTQQAHGCPHTFEDLQWFYRNFVTANPETKNALVVHSAVEDELKDMGCSGQ